MFYPNVTVAECDSCKLVTHDDDTEVLLAKGWTQDDRDSTFCPSCSAPATEDAPTEAEADAFAAAIEKEAEPLLEEKERQKAEAIKAQAELYGTGWNKRIEMIKAKQKKKGAKLSQLDKDLLDRDEKLRELNALDEFFTIQATEIVRQRMEE